MTGFIRIVIVGALLSAALVLTPTAAGPVDAACGVSIYRIYYDSPGSDTGANSSLNAEWIQLKNGCSSSVSLTNWTIKDAVNHGYRFGSYKLAAGSKVTVHTGSGTNTSTNRYWGQGWYIWNNTGDTAKLRNGAGKVMDTCVYSGGGASVYC
jgi:Lamin Tail Domain